MAEYTSPLRVVWRDGVNEPYIQITESLKVVRNHILLKEIPDPWTRVSITGFSEVRSITALAPNRFYVDYNLGIVTFDPIHNGQTVNVSYMGRGIVLLDARRVYVPGEDEDALSTLLELIEHAEEGLEALTLVGDAVDAIEEFKHLGEYSPSVQYKPRNLVTYNNNTYMNIVASIGIPPTNTNYWRYIAGGGSGGGLVPPVQRTQLAQDIQASLAKADNAAPANHTHNEYASKATEHVHPNKSALDRLGVSENNRLTIDGIEQIGGGGSGLTPPVQRTDLSIDVQNSLAKADNAAPANHNHDDKYAAIDHTHSGVYAPVNHNHDDKYAAINHDHNGVYAPANHNHDGTYAPVNHNHDSAYAAKSTEHTHQNKSHLDRLTVTANNKLAIDGVEQTIDVDENDIVDVVTSRYLIVDPRRYGAVGNGTADDTNALREAVGLLTNSGQVIIAPGVYRITGPVTISNKHDITIEFQGKIIADNCDGIIIENCYQVTLRIASLVSADRTISWNNQRAGLTIRNTDYIRMNIDNLEEFHKGVYLYANDDGIAYVNTTFGTVRNCYYGVYAEVVNNGWINELVWNGGKFFLDTNIYSNSVSNGSSAFYFKPLQGQNLYNNHRFIGVCFENLRKGVHMPNCVYFTFLAPRMETVDVWLEGNENTASLHWIIGYPFFEHSKVINIGDDYVILGRNTISSDLIVDAWRGMSFAAGNDPSTNARIMYHTGSRYFQIYDQLGGMSIIGNGRMLASDGCGWRNGVLAVNSTNVVRWASSTPSSGTYNFGDMIFNTNPIKNADGTVRIGWVCTASGSPGTWTEVLGFHQTPQGGGGIEVVTSLPTANASLRGKVVFLQGGTGVADGIYVCKKLANGTYNWVQLG